MRLVGVSRINVLNVGGLISLVELPFTGGYVSYIFVVIFANLALNLIVDRVPFIYSDVSRINDTIRFRTLKDILIRSSVSK